MASRGGRMRRRYEGARDGAIQLDATAVFMRAREQLGWHDVDMPVAHGFVRRLLGLLPVPLASGGKPPGMAFPRCDSVHTCFMRCTIDIAFIDASGDVLELHEGIGPWHILRCRGAWGVMERLGSR